MSSFNSKVMTQEEGEKSTTNLSGLFVDQAQEITMTTPPFLTEIEVSSFSLAPP